MRRGANSDGYYFVNLKTIEEYNTISYVGLGTTDIIYNGRSYPIHEIIAKAFISNPENKRYVDHINNNKKDNSLGNLRFTILSPQRRKHTIRSINTSGATGVFYDYGVYRWKSSIKINCKNILIGYFDTFEEGVQARDKYCKTI